MNQGKYVFAQIADFIPRYEFDNCVRNYKGNRKIRNLTCRDQFLAMMFGQLANLKSFRGIVICFNAHREKLYHLGFGTKKLILSTFTRANEKRDWRIYRDLAQILIERARKLYLNSNDFSIDLKGTPYALDSTVIKLSLGLFKWAKFKKETSAVKVHTQLDLRGNIPSFFLITEAKIHDVNLLDILEFEEGAYYIMDRGYIDFKRLYRIHQKKAFFIIRSKSSTSFIRLYSQKTDKISGVRCDQIIKFKQFYATKNYPEKLRRIKYYDEETDHYYTYLTNNFDLDARIVADLYKHRWQIELFFKWIKQHLHIGTFWGHSANAVKIQICIAISAFLVIAIIKKELKIERDLYEILQILSISQFEKTAINTLVSESDDFLNDHAQKQACLFDF
jgi:Transposase DDE domain/Domain of unknown function (DUF4372)